jgi:polysaccharide export outer membrane protein
VSFFRISRLLSVACASLLLWAALDRHDAAAQSASDLDTLAYGSLKPGPRPAERGLFTNGPLAGPTANGLREPGRPGLLSFLKPAVDREQLAAAKAEAELDASADNAPRAEPTSPPAVIMAAPVAEARIAPRPAMMPSARSEGGLLSALGIVDRAPAPMQANAQMHAPAAIVLPPRAVVAVVPVAYPPPVVVRDPVYRLDSGDKLRVVIYGQEGLTNTYAIDAGGGITLPLIGRVTARGMTPAGLADSITARLRKGYIREPSVAVEIESYRPFFILGEVAAPGQYPYVPNMSVEAAVAIAGGFSPRARRDQVMLTHPVQGGLYRATVPLGTPLSPGDTITVGERWF